MARRVLLLALTATVLVAAVTAVDPKLCTFCAFGSTGPCKDLKSNACFGYVCVSHPLYHTVVTFQAHTTIQKQTPPLTPYLHLALLPLSAPLSLPPLPLPLRRFLKPTATKLAQPRAALRAPFPATSAPGCSPASTAAASMASTRTPASAWTAGLARTATAWITARA